MLRMWRVIKSNPWLYMSLYGLKFVLDLEMQHSILQLELQVTIGIRFRIVEKLLKPNVDMKYTA